MSSTSLIDKIKKASKLEHANVLTQQNIPETFTPTDVIIMNVALSGTLDGGFGSGITQFAGPSKHFKTNFGLVCVRSYLNTHKDSVCMFIDSEFGAKLKYFESLGIDTDRIVHLPVTNIEELKFELSTQLEGLTSKDKVILFIDSIGNLASKKEVEDAANSKSVADMTRAKQLKSLFRIITPQLKLKDIPCIVINHTYESQDSFFPTAVVSGGTGHYYSSDNVFIVGRAQEKKGTVLNGYKFTLVADKSRTVKEKSKFPVTVNFDSGINKYSGLIELAEASGVIRKVSGAPSFARDDIDPVTGTVTPNDTKFYDKMLLTDEFWKPILINPKFHQYVSEQFILGEKNELLSADSDFVEEIINNSNQLRELWGKMEEDENDNEPTEGPISI